MLSRELFVADVPFRIASGEFLDWERRRSSS